MTSFHLSVTPQRGPIYDDLPQPEFSSSPFLPALRPEFEGVINDLAVGSVPRTVLHALLEHRKRALSTAQLAALTGLSVVIVEGRLAALLEHRWVLELRDGGQTSYIIQGRESGDPQAFPVLRHVLVEEFEGAISDLAVGRAPQTVTHVLINHRSRALSVAQIAAGSGLPVVVVEDRLAALEAGAWALALRTNGVDEYVITGGLEEAAFGWAER